MKDIILIIALALVLCAISLCVFLLVTRKKCDQNLKDVFLSVLVSESVGFQNNTWVIDAGYPLRFFLHFKDQSVAPKWCLNIKPFQTLHLSLKKPKKECIELTIAQGDIHVRTDADYFVGYSDNPPDIQQICQTVAGDCQNQLQIQQTSYFGFYSLDVKANGYILLPFIQVGGKNQFFLKELQKVYLFVA